MLRAVMPVSWASSSIVSSAVLPEALAIAARLATHYTKPCYTPSPAQKKAARLGPPATPRGRGGRRAVPAGPRLPEGGSGRRPGLTAVKLADMFQVCQMFVKSLYIE